MELDHSQDQTTTFDFQYPHICGPVLSCSLASHGFRTQNNQSCFATRPTTTGQRCARDKMSSFPKLVQTLRHYTVRSLPTYLLTQYRTANMVTTCAPPPTPRKNTWTPRLSHSPTQLTYSGTHMCCRPTPLPSVSI